MSQVKISALTAVAASGGDYVPTVSGGVTKKVTQQNIANLRAAVTITEANAAGVGIPKHLLAAGAVAGDVAVAAIKVGDRLDEVLHLIYTAGVITDITDLTAEFTVLAAKINNTGGTSSATNKLMIRYTKLTP